MPTRQPEARPCALDDIRKQFQEPRRKRGTHTVAAASIPCAKHEHARTLLPFHPGHRTHARKPGEHRTFSFPPSICTGIAPIQKWSTFCKGKQDPPGSRSVGKRREIANDWRHAFSPPPDLFVLALLPVLPPLPPPPFIRATSAASGRPRLRSRVSPPGGGASR